MNNHCEDLLLPYYFNGLEAKEREIVEKHLEECKECRIELELRKELAEVLTGKTFEIDSEHCLDTETLARYAFNEMIEDEMADAEEHFDECVFCRSEATLLRETQQEIYDTPVYEPIIECKIINFNALKLNIQNNMQDNISWRSKKTAYAQTQPKPELKSELVLAKHEINIAPVNGEIVLVGQGSEHEKLLKKLDTIDERQFFYKIFCINKDGGVDEKCRTTDEKRLDGIKLKDAGFSFLLVFISQKQDFLEKIGKDLLLNIYAGKPCEPLKDVVCIFVTIKRD